MEQDEEPRQESYGRRFGFLKLLLAIGVISFVIYLISGGEEAKKGAGGPVPVKVAAVKRQDVPYYLTGIGTIESPHSAEIRTQVDGELVQINFKEGEDVKAGQVLAVIDSRSIRAALAEARAQRANAAAQLQTAKLDAQRYDNLLKADAIARQTVDQQQATVKQLQASLDAADATIDANEVRLSYTRIKSPVTGRVGIRRVDAGNILKTSDPEGIVKVTQVKPITAIFTLPQTAVNELRGKDVKTIPVDAIAKDGHQIIAGGTLTAVDSEVDDETGTIKLRAEFANEDDSLWPGQLATLRLQNGILKDAKVIPVIAVQRGNDGPFVWKLDGTDGTSMQKVGITYEDTDIAVIESGLTFEDKVVIDGQSRLKDGSKVKIAADKTPEKTEAEKPANEPKL